jgi:hypothetical protein
MKLIYLTAKKMMSTTIKSIIKIIFVKTTTIMIKIPITTMTLLKVKLLQTAIFVKPTTIMSKI